VADTLDADPTLGLMDIPTGVLDIQPGAPVGVAASPLDFGNGEALPFTQQVLLIEKFGTDEAMPTAAAPAWTPLGRRLGPPELERTVSKGVLQDEVPGVKRRPTR